MRADHHMLLAIDDSEASRKAVSYVARVVGDAPRFRVRLFHVLPHIPTGLLEHGGHEDPETERSIESELDEETARWRARAEDAASSLVDAARASLLAAGLREERIDVRFAAPLPEESIGYHILRAALEHGCDTVVVGRTPRSWIGDALHRHPTRNLLGPEARGIALWIVT